MALATADRRGTPSVRYVLLKGADARRLRLLHARRAGRAASSPRRPRAAIAFYWDAIGKQVRVEGRVRRSRPRSRTRTGPRGPARASCPARCPCRARPCRAIAGFSRAGAASRAGSGQAARFPVRKSGVVTASSPIAIEFWHRGPHRLHRRERYTKRTTRWRHQTPPYPEEHVVTFPRRAWSVLHETGRAGCQGVPPRAIRGAKAGPPWHPGGRRLASPNRRSARTRQSPPPPRRRTPMKDCRQFYIDGKWVAPTNANDSR
jgi:pyridoxamine 5'-phosphate oxidase